MSILLTAAFSYLLGSIPFGFILVRIFRGQDVRLTGSGNIGCHQRGALFPRPGSADTRS
jgi:glycerol-3-phosphate acyltransferase PlsY